MPVAVRPGVWVGLGVLLAIGVSVEDQQTADERIPLLLQIPAAVRLVSVEPMLGNVDLSKKGTILVWSDIDRLTIDKGGVARTLQKITKK